MDEDRAGTVREWNSRSVEGHAGLRRLADEGFSGVIETDRGSIRAFMMNGRIVGITGADIEDLDGTAMTAYSAPDDALPLLFAMQERAGEPRAQYYTEETPISEVNRTLEEGGFTGYIELSENVLSGDYYVVYHGGRSSSVAFVGSSSRLLTGDEAFERADGEVGIYDVVDADVSVIEVPGDEGTTSAGDDGGAVAGAGAGAGPEPPSDSTAGGSGSGAASTPGGTGGAEDAVDSAPGTGDGADSAGVAAGGATDDRADGSSGDDGGIGADVTGPEAGDAGDGSTDRAADAGDADRAGESSSRGTGPYGTGEEIRVGAGLGIDDGEGTEADTDPGDAATGSVADEGAPAESAGGKASDGVPDRGTADGTDAEDPTPGPADEQPTGSAGGSEAPADGRSSDASSPQERPPEGADADAGGGAPADVAPDAEDEARSADTTADAATDDAETTGDPTPSAGDEGASQGSRPGDGRADARTGRGSGPTRDSLAAELREARETLERVRAERDEYRTDAERLRERIATLETRIETLEAAEAAGTDAAGTAGEADATGTDADAAARSFSRSEALANTNLFVRYGSKAEPTLEAAHDGGADPTAVNRNLRIEHHTRFEAEDAVVDGEPFEEFLPASFEYQFVEWVIRRLLYELRSTGSRPEMEQLYDALPAIDRVQFGGEVQIGGGADEGERDARGFDVIFRDRMGGPLLVANLHESRDPTGAGVVTTLVEDARTVAVAAETIGAAFVVSTSYYEPQALEAASSATSGGFLSRSRKESYVKMDRKRGFHLCLAEARDGEFNLRIPEL